VTTETLTLTGFLLARIAEDEAEAAKLLRRAQDHELAIQEPRLLGTTIPGWHDWPLVQDLAARVLAECEAKRRIVEMAQETLATEGAGFPADDSGFEEAHSLAAATLRALATVYADHPEFREDWRP